MGASWNIRQLKDCAKWYSGGTPRKSNPDYWGGVIPWISAKSLNDFFVADSEDKVTELAIGNGTRLVQKNTILFVVRGMSLKTEFRMGITTRPVSFNQDVKALVAEEDIDPDYLAYAIKAKTEEILSLVEEAGHGTGVLPTSLIQSLEVNVPTLVEQKRIAGIFRAIDDKIELDRQMNATLEAMAQALFKSWFVDFDPVIDNALAAGNPIPEPLHARAETRKALGDQRKPIPEAIQQQFPNRFVFTEEMGWVPEGWEVQPLDKIAHYQNGLALQKFRPEDENDFLPVVKIAQLKKGFADGEEKASPNIKAECIIDDGDVIFSWSGSLMVDIWCGGKAALNQHLFKVTSESHPKWFYYQYTCHHLNEFQRIAADKAVTMGHIKREHLSQAYCAVPPSKLVNECSGLIDSLMNRSIRSRVENSSLENTRDTLLPKLLSGQLRIPDAEAMVEQAAAG